MVDELKRIPGVGDVLVFGARDYSMRIWLNPDRMAQLGVTAADIGAAISAQNAQYAAGKIGAEPALPGQELRLHRDGARPAGRAGGVRRHRRARRRPGRRAADQGRRARRARRAELRPVEQRQRPAVDRASAVFLQSGANALDTARRGARRGWTSCKQAFPPGVDYLIPFDTTLFVSASIHEVVKTIFEAAVLVLLVVFVFLQTWRATLIPMLAVPVSLIGTFAGLWLLGFSINTLTLFAMVLAIGIVVDDAIVVLENVERLMREERMSAAGRLGRGDARSLRAR